MKVHVDPVPLGLSQAMWRVANALRASAPADVEIVASPELADVQVLHVIGRDCGLHLRAPAYAVIQYCGGLEAAPDGRNVPVASPAVWEPLWRGAVAIWSYFDLRVPKDIPFYLAPLGVNTETFCMPPDGSGLRAIGAMTSGYVAGPGAEAIEEVAIAAERSGLTTLHLGPKSVQGMQRYPSTWKWVMGVSDTELAGLYQRTRWVSGLRHEEGFELPVLEGLACGARPIVFDRPDMRRWYDGHAVFVPECDGGRLVDELMKVLARDPSPVTREERDDFVQWFEWSALAAGFWSAVRAGMGMGVAA